jgi:Skp family chaperone for outer membrane proteins
VKEPFRGSGYESNNRFFRGTGKGESSADNIARGKADIEAKTQLAGQVNTTMKQVADQYLGQTQNEKAADVADKFQSLVREVMNTNIADVRKIGEEKYFNKKENRYTVFIAYEIKKNAMFRFMKKQAKVNQTIDERQQEVIQKILDEELKKADEDEKN